MKQTMDWIGSIAAQNKLVSSTGLLFDGAKLVKPNNMVSPLDDLYNKGGYFLKFPGSIAVTTIGKCEMNSIDNQCEIFLGGG